MSKDKRDDSRIPEKDAVKKLRELFEKRKSGLLPSPEMDEILKQDPSKKGSAEAK